MSEKRKDKKGRILRTGESQRPDMTYQYRYNDIYGKRRYVYAPTLDELREKEQAIQRDLMDGIDYVAGEMTVIELVDRYMSIRRGLSPNSLRAYGTAINRIKESAFGKKKVKTVKLSDAKAWFVGLHDNGMKQNTIGVIQSVVRPAFEMAVDDDMIRKNPFKFNLADIVPKDAFVRNALTKAQQERYLQFMRDNGKGNYYDDIIILLGTGLRVSELYGLTKGDINFETRTVNVWRQLCRTAETPYFVKEPKTKSGIRSIPMSQSVYEAFQRVFINRGVPTVEMMIDGHTGFLFLDRSDRPKVGMHLQNYMRLMQRRYVKQYGKTLPTITPHVLRHTFCTNAQKAGIDVKSLQYLMGHSNVSVTLDVYSHTDFDTVQSAFQRIAANL